MGTRPLQATSKFALRNPNSISISVSNCKTSLSRRENSPFLPAMENQATLLMEKEEEAHPFAFHVSGPRNVVYPNWRDLINSSWKDEKYKRTVIACFIQAVYLLELDRQEGRTEENALAPEWWTPFKYKLTRTLLDERDGSIFGAVLEWDRSAALADMILIRPSGAPKAILALRGTLLKTPTIRRDIQDDFRFLAWESLKGSIRFRETLEALKNIAESYGSSNVCIAGHSLGAGFALQVGKTLAKEGLYVEAHLFNPPSVSVAMSLRNIGEKAVSGWKRIRAVLPSNTESPAANGVEDNKSYAVVGLMNRIPNFGNNSAAGMKKWVPHLYVNNSDYICCSYTDPGGDKNEGNEETVGEVAAKLFVTGKGNQKFLEAHGLEQWWSDDVELQMALNNSKLISRQLKSLHSLPASQQPPQKLA